MLIWLQKVLIECCFVKLNILSGKIRCKDLIAEEKIQIMEPIPHHCICNYFFLLNFNSFYKFP